MAYNQRYNPDALPAHAEPEQAAQMFGQRDHPSRRDPPPRDPPSRNSRNDGVGRSDSYANRPPPPIPTPIQTVRRDEYRHDSRMSGGYDSPIRDSPRENSYDRDRRQAPSQPGQGARNSSYSYDNPPPPARQSVYGNDNRRYEPPPPSAGYRERGSAPPVQARDSLDRDSLWSIFQNVDIDRTGQLSEAELGRGLVNGDYTAFDPHTVRMMIRMFDVDKSGTISFNEFVGLWGFLSDWRKLFDRFDVDNSGTISFDEFKEALITFGYTLSNEYVRLLFGVHDVRKRGALSFDLFVQSCISLKRMTDVFKKYDTDRDGMITLSFEEFLTGTQDLFIVNSMSATTDRGHAY